MSKLGLMTTKTTWAVDDAFGDNVTVGLSSKDEAIRVARGWMRDMGIKECATAVRIYEQCPVDVHAGNWFMEHPHHDYTRDDLLG